eukprot:jgi/Mesvir1/26237/Mv02412-RA.2
MEEYIYATKGVGNCEGGEELDCVLVEVGNVGGGHGAAGGAPASSLLEVPLFGRPSDYADAALFVVGNAQERLTAIQVHLHALEARKDEFMKTHKEEYANVIKSLRNMISYRRSQLNKRAQQDASATMNWQAAVNIGETNVNRAEEAGQANASRRRADGTARKDEQPGRRRKARRRRRSPDDGDGGSSDPGDVGGANEDEAGYGAGSDGYKTEPSTTSDGLIPEPWPDFDSTASPVAFIDPIEARWCNETSGQRVVRERKERNQFGITGSDARRLMASRVTGDFAGFDKVREYCLRPIADVPDEQRPYDLFGHRTSVCRKCGAPLFNEERRGRSPCCSNGKMVGKGLEPNLRDVMLKRRTWEEMVAEGRGTAEERAEYLLTPQEEALRSIHCDPDNVRQWMAYGRSINRYFAVAHVVASKPIGHAAEGRGASVLELHGQTVEMVDPLVIDGKQSNNTMYMLLGGAEKSQALASVTAKLDLREGQSGNLLAELEKYFSDYNELLQNFVHQAETVLADVREGKMEVAEKDKAEVDAQEIFIFPADTRTAEPAEFRVDFVKRNADGEQRYRRRLVMGDQRYMPLAFPVLFSEGVGLWWYGRGASKDGSRSEKLGKILKYCLYSDERFRNKGTLRQLFALHAFSCVQDNRLSYVRSMQEDVQLRTATVREAEDALRQLEQREKEEDIDYDAVDAGDEVLDELRVGKKVIIPAGVGFGVRARASRIQDQLAAIVTDGEPSHFVTMTCNPRWKEILDNVPAKPDGTKEPLEHPDIVDRVFKLKLRFLISLITSGVVFGRKPVYLTYVIEYQTRGLPHAHIIYRLPKVCHPTNENGLVDQHVWAELPPVEMPELREKVLTHMVHNHHRGTKCMQGRRKEVEQPPRMAARAADVRAEEAARKEYDEGLPDLEECDANVTWPVCQKKFPKAYVGRTYVDARGYMQYRRRPLCKLNRWIVPYNPVFLLLLDCHINVEIVASIHIVEYLNKYMNKSDETADVKVTSDGNDEIADYLAARLVSASRAEWVLMGFHEHFMRPGCSLLPLHVPKENEIAYMENVKGSMEKALRERSHTELQVYFGRPSEEDLPGMDAIKYIKFYRTYSVHKAKSEDEEMDARRKGKEIKVPKDALRNANGEVIFCVVDTQRADTESESGDPSPPPRYYLKLRKKRHYARIYIADLRKPQLFFLRTLLLKRAGRSWQDLCTVDGEVLTYEEACQRLHLLEDDNEAVEAMRQAVERKSAPPSLRRLFCVLLLQNMATPEQLWKFRDDMCVDYVDNEYAKRCGDAARPEGITFADRQRALARLMDYLDKRLCDRGVDVWALDPQLKARRDAGEDVFAFEQPRPHRGPRAFVGDFSMEQTLSFQTIMHAVRGEISHRRFFVDGLAGTGKTRVLNAVVQQCNHEGRNVVAMAFTGVAATQVRGGRTSHHFAGFPLELDTEAGCGVRFGSAKAKVLIDADVIIYDEISMVHKVHLQLLDALLRDLLGSKDEPFGGKVMVFAGDFRQVAPPVGDSTRACAASVVRSDLWVGVRKLALTRNFRCNEEVYSQMLLDVGTDRMRRIKVENKKTGRLEAIKLN